MASESFISFCLIYLSHYFTLEPADFHREIMEDMQNEKIQFLAIEGFRGSAKSTIAIVAYVLWLALEEKEKFIIPINETDDVVRITIANIREEIENNAMIVRDYGEQIVKKGASSKFTETNILLANGCRIFGRSRGQKIRGLRHRQYRIGVAIADDVEEIDKVGKKLYRDKTERWILGTVIPAMEETKGRFIILGNKLHNDAIMERLKHHKLFKYREYALLDKNGKCRWPAKYPNKAALERQELKVGRTAWLREYLLKVVPEDGQVIADEDIHYYDHSELPNEINTAGVGVDLAISQRATADSTAMVPGLGTYVDGKPKIYILPVVNEKLDFHDTIERLKLVRNSLKIYVAGVTFYIEDVAYQKAAIQEAQRHMLAVKSMKPNGDKRARLETASPYIKNGTVLFPRKGAEKLIEQLIGFGVEDHDDLVDALVHLIQGMADTGLQKFEVIGLV